MSPAASKGAYNASLGTRSVERTPDSGYCHPDLGSRGYEPVTLARLSRAVILKEWSAFGSLGTVLGAGILAILDAHRVQRAPHHMIANPREVLDAPTANQHDGMRSEEHTSELQSR